MQYHTSSFLNSQNPGSDCYYSYPAVRVSVEYLWGQEVGYPRHGPHLLPHLLVLTQVYLFIGDLLTVQDQLDSVLFDVYLKAQSKTK